MITIAGTNAHLWKLFSGKMCLCLSLLLFLIIGLKLLFPISQEVIMEDPSTCCSLPWVGKQTWAYVSSSTQRQRDHSAFPPPRAASKRIIST